ncbi:PAS domain S-box protein (plasmid) [Deinococcus taeanensis]|uniref:PAS domain S-box protein n=1 Tax=Deinococcus taeanensis TaxID=2737050 RepID=UPI001CDB5075|nr:PAS domain S-box protein [Deinococcus taeanensis]UBV45283.1 PAS domain S-box protein [Deinococcus taeanensis]
MNIPVHQTLQAGWSTLDALPIPALALNEAGEVNYANSAWRVAGALSTAEFLAMLHPDEAAHAVAQWNNDRAHHRPSALTVRLRAADGTYHPHRADHHRLPDESRLLGQWLLTFTEVQAHPAEATQLAWDESPDCIKTLDLNGHLLSMNAGGLRVMELGDFAACAGASWPEFWTNDTRPLVEAAVKAAREGGIGHFEGFCRTFAGTPKWWEVTVRGVPGATGQPTHLLAVSRDITERVRGERLARGQTDVLEALIRGEALEDVLERMAHLVEGLVGDAHCVIFRLDAAQGVLRPTAAPSLDAPLLEALQAVPLGRAGGACGLAAESGEVTSVKDYQVDPQWGHVRDFAQAIGVRACWSTPLLDDAGEVHGTLALYFTVPTTFTAEHREVTRAAARLATLALQQDRARDALRRNEVRYRTLFEALPHIVWTSTGMGQSNHFNQRWQAMTGLPTQTQGLEWAEAIHPDDRGRAVLARQRGLSTGAPYGADIRFRRADGTYRWHAAHVVPLPAHQATDDYQWLGYAVDIHDRAEAESALRESADHFRRLADVNPIGVALGHPDGRVSYANDAYLRLLHVTRADLEADTVNWHALTPPEWHARDAQAVAQARERGYSDPYEKEYLLANGHRLPVLVAVAQLDDTGDTQVRYVLDLTDRKVLERTLNDENMQLRALNAQILASAADGVFGLDLQGHTTFANPAALQMTGFPLEEILGRQQHALLHHTRADGTPYPPSDCSICRVTQDGTPRRATDELFWRKDGTGFPVEYTATPLLDGDGGQVGVVVTFRDITERQHVERTLRAANEELRRSNQDLERFAFVASHDLQEPLRTVASFTELLARRYAGTDPKAERYAQLVVGGVGRMKATIEDLLVFSRVRAETQQWEVVETETVLEHALAALAATVDASGAQITWDALPAVRGDATQLTQVLTNLLSNALKFCRAGVPPQVHVSARRTDHLWHIGVSDNGLGIEEAYVERVFDMFQRLHRREAYPGTGMGLTIVRRIVERHGGRAWVTSTPGAGSTFHFTLPAEGLEPRLA